ncbi:unnamed protein product [Brassica rapa subsp. trilocularis]
MPTFRMNLNLELREFTQPLLIKRRVHPTSVTSIITSNKGIHYVELSIIFSLLPFQVNIFAKGDDLQNQAQPLEDFARRLKPKEKSVVTVVGKTFDQLVSNCPDNVHLEFRKVSVPSNRYSPLEKAWLDIYTPIYHQMKVDIRMNRGSRKVELKTLADTPDISNLQKSADFVHAFMLGFDIPDVISLLRVDELYVESIEIKLDVKTLKGKHLPRAIGRLSGKGGKTKFAIENSTKTRIVIADTRIHILGAFSNIKTARDSLYSLIMGSPAGKVYVIEPKKV